MIMRHKLSIVAVAALLFSTTALADNYQQRDAAGATQTFASKLVGLLQHPYGYGGLLRWCA
jgi:hypothetical protein